MSNPTENGVCDNHFSCKKGVCYQCGVCIYCNAPSYFQSKINQKTLWYPHSIINLTEENKIEQNNNIPWKS